MGSGLLLVWMLSSVSGIWSAELPRDSYCSQAAGVALQGAQRQGREAALAAVRKQPLDAKAIDANVAGIVSLLGDLDPAVQNQALAAVLWRPEAFVPQQQRLTAMVAAANESYVMRAIAALAPHLLLPIDDCFALLASSDSSKHDRGLRALLAHGDDLAPRIREVVFLLARFPHFMKELLPALKSLAGRHRESILAAVRSDFAVGTGNSRYGLLRAKLLHELGAPRLEVEAVLLAAVKANGQVLPLCREYAETSASFRAGLVKLGMSAASYRYPNVFRLLEEFATKLEPQWPELAKGLTVPKLAARVAPLAWQLRAQRPGVIDDLLAAIGKASPEVLGQLAPQLLHCPERTADFADALAKRLMTAGSAGPAVMDVVLALQGQQQLSAALPQLLAHQDAKIRARACLLTVVLGMEDKATRASLESLTSDSDPAVCIEAKHALRFVRGEVTDDQLADQVRDREIHRVIQAYSTSRRRHETFTSVEAVAAQMLVTKPAWVGWMHRCLRQDHDSGRAKIAQIRPFLVRIASWAAPQVEKAWAGTDVVVQAAAKAVVNPPLPQAVLDLAAKSKLVRDQLIAAGRLSPDFKFDTPEEIARKNQVQLDRHFTDLGDSDVGVRSNAFLALQKRRQKDWREAGKQLRRSGSAHQRRLFAALVEPMDRYAAMAALWAEEPAVMARGIQWFGSRVDLPGGMDDLRECAEQLMQQPDRWRNMVAASGPTFVRQVAMLGADALPLLREAMQDARCRSRVLQALPWLGGEAREFTPQLLRGLRTRDCRPASLALLSIGLKPGDEYWQAFRAAVAAQWRQAAPNRRREMLPAICALGDGSDDFAMDGIASLLGSPGGLLSNQISTPIRAWVEAGMRSDTATRRRVAMLVVSAGALESIFRGTGRTPSSIVWQRAASAPGMRIAMQEAVGQTSKPEMRELLALMLDAVAAGKPAPATAVIFAARSDLVLQVLVEDRSNLLGDADVLLLLAESMPITCIRWLAVADPVPNQAVSLLRHVPQSAGVHAELVRGLMTVSAHSSSAFCRALVMQGDVALAAIAAQLRGSEERRREMLVALSSAGSSAEFAVDALLQGVVDRSLADQQAIHRALLVMGRAGLVAFLRLVGEEQGVAGLEQAALSGDAGTAGAALRLLQQLWPMVAVRAAKHQLRGAPEVRRWAGFILLADEAFLSEDDSRQAAILLKVLSRDSDAIVRRRAAEGLLRMPTWSYEAAVVATELLSDPAKNVRMIAIRAFAKHLGEVAASRAALQEAVAVEPHAGLRRELQRVLRPR